MKEAIKRIVLDLKDLTNGPIENIYYYPDEENIFLGSALIIGPENTPYQYGNYIFEFHFTKKYPYEPPKVLYKTNDGKTRFNPNFYRNGKVCLSILNTWSGDQWSACQTIRSVLLTLQTTMNQLPLMNEPGIKESNMTYILEYNDIIEYKNLQLAILYYISEHKNVPIQNDDLINKIDELFEKNKSKILNIVSKLSTKSNKNIHLHIYDMCEHLNYQDLNREYMKLIERNK
jgi:ubiquitin-conjugating enzyme E2 Z